MRQTLKVILGLTAILGVAAAGCGGDDNPGSPGPGGGGGADVTINILANSGSSSYSPSPDTVLIGQTVAWHNSDTMTHTATADGGGFNTGNVPAGGTSTAITMAELRKIFELSRMPS